MTQQGLPVNKLISVSVTLTPSGTQGANLNSAMIVGDSAVIDVVTRYREYESLDEVGTDFGTTAPEYLASQVYFDQQPTPQNVFIGRWAKTATPGQLWGGPPLAVNQLAATWAAITTGAFFIFINGTPYYVSGLNFTNVANLNGVAAIIATALDGLLASTTFVWDAAQESFVAGSPTTGPGSTVSFASAPTAFGYFNINTNPAANETITVDGTVVTFVAAGPVGQQVLIGVDATHTQANLLAFLNGDADANIAKMTYYSTAGGYIYCVSKATGTAGDAYTLATSAGNITISGATLTGGGGIDVSGMLAMLASSSGAYVANGIAAESALASVIILDSQNVSWYALAFAAGAGNGDVSDSDYVAVAGYVEGAANKHLFFITTAEGAAITSNDSSSIGFQLKALNYLRSPCQWSSTNPYAALSSVALGVGIDFDAQNSTINWQYKQQPGVVAENLSLAQSSALDANHYSYCANYQNGAAIITNGYCPDGHYIDEVWNSDWFANRVQTDLFNFMFQTATKVPQTDAGMHLLATVMKGSCDAAVNNGFAGPGTWGSSGFGTLTTGQFMPQGYYIYQPPISSQAPSARSARKSVPFQIALKEAGAVNDVVVAVVVNQ